jgi:murein DD-endopeptidase MepM/ murein hydrolase activator NlpD
MGAGGKAIFMRGRLLMAWAQRLAVRTFRDREVFVRSAGQVRFASVSWRRQVAGVGLIGSLALWSIYVTVVYFSYDSRLADRDAKIDAVRSAYQRIVAERDVATKRVSEAYQSLLARGETGEANIAALNLDSEYELIALRTRTTLLGREVADLQGELKGVNEERAKLASEDDRLAHERADLTQQLADLRDAHAKLADQVADLRGQLKSADQRYADLGHERDKIAGQFKGARDDAMAMQERNNGDEARIASLESDLSALQGQRDKMADDRGSLDQKVVDLQRHLAALQADQQALVKRLSDRAAHSSSEAERRIAMTGLNVDKLLAEVTRSDDEGAAAGAKNAKPTKPTSGKGGPFVAFKPGQKIEDQSSLHSVEIDRLVTALDNQEERRAGLRKILEHLPLAAPIAHYRIMSPFGPRIDPLNGRYAMHEGVDLASAPGAPVMATAPGIVTYAGWDGSYGKMVEIDHGMGIHTRYAHLRAITTEVGRHIAAGTQVGTLGSTGRSTGPHVHYEIRVDDHPHNPVKFMQAGEYVFSKN